ncbi:cysteine ase [Micractinium conductrix]|uniref:Cysteine ase n=1 Tax=Micractinium conductrix TaxID=554055 RepID=A0A2P6VCK9_9CHLO|nr:cysteine ase [Micractinium conductrix]|eukprot:PSC71791.1 cysteine ase [Micractinium conductrix]
MALSDVHLMLGPSQDCLGGNHVACDGAESQTSSRSSCTHAVEQAGSWPDLFALRLPTADHSMKHPAAAAGQLQQQPAAAAGSAQQQGPLLPAWLPGMHPTAGAALPAVQAHAAAATAWQHCPGGGGFGVHHHHHRHHHHQQPLTLAAAVDAALAGDPWADGLDLVAGGSCCDDSSPLGLPLTDPGLEALLAPFQDWPDLLLQPAGSTAELPLAAAPPAAPPALLHPQQQRHEQQHQQAAAASPTAAAAAAAAAAPRSASTSTRRSASAAPAISSDGSDGASGSAAPRRHGGRPRKQPGAAPAAARRPPASASAAAGAPPATARPFKKSGRGPKPKYVFQTVEEAADARRERNRKAALESYYRKKEHSQRLQAAKDQLLAENAALQQLLGGMRSSGLCPLMEASDAGIDEWLKQQGEPGCTPVSAEVLSAFATNADGKNSVTRAQAADIACHLKPLLDRAAANDADADATLTAVYQAWRQAFRPQSWGGKPTDSKANWMGNLATIVTINSNRASRFWAGLNAYSGLTAEQFAEAVLMTPELASVAGGSRKLLAKYGSVAPTYPSLINWVNAGKVLPAPGFQAACGSSWAFAATGALESKLMIDSKLNTTAALSPQHIMDCTARMFAYTDSTCNGGSPTDAFQYAAERGVTADDAYRYRSATPGSDADAESFLEQCDRPVLTGRAAHAGLVRISVAPAFKQVPASNKVALITALAAQPAVTTLAVDATFQHYAGGIWTSTACGTAPNHALLLVGYSTQTAGQEHFLAKNSLGAGWGEAGFVRLAMAGDGAGLCGMYRAAYQPAAVVIVGPGKPGNGNA